MIRQSFRVLIMLMMVFGYLGTTPAMSMNSAREAGHSNMPVKDFVHQFYIEGIPYAEAAKYGPDAVPTLLAMLDDPQEKPYWSNIVVTLGAIGDERAVDPLIAFVEKGGDTMTREEFQAKSSVLMSLGYLINKSNNEKALSYLKAHLSPEGWRESNMATARAQGFKASTDLRTKQLSTLAVLGLALSGHPSAKSSLNFLNQGVRDMAPTAFTKQMTSVVTEALKAHETIARDGLESYYQKAKSP